MTRTNFDSLDPLILRKSMNDALEMDFMDLVEARQAVLVLDVMGPNCFSERLDEVISKIRSSSESHARFVLVEQLVAPLFLAVYQATQTCDLGLMVGGDA